MTPQEFIKASEDGLMVVFDALEAASRKGDDPPRAPANFKDWMRAARRLSNAVMLSASVEDAKKEIEADPGAALAVKCIFDMLPDDDWRIATKLAYEKTQASTLFPMQALAAIVIQLSEGLELREP